ncbi:hypothetical protein [Sphingomonas panacis]|uniref:hypothetical protein n=1 Tax=Sphingomonas panacis TaxID=1560345 RepID=UPI001237834A|nr:hypothetical protein [Sphingomonas panacis]
MFVSSFKLIPKAGLELKAIEAAKNMSLLLKLHCGSNGSSLYRGLDGGLYAHAKWPSLTIWEQRERDIVALHDAKADMDKFVSDIRPIFSSTELIFSSIE